MKMLLNRDSFHLINVLRNRLISWEGKMFLCIRSAPSGEVIFLLGCVLLKNFTGKLLSMSSCFVRNVLPALDAFGINSREWILRVFPMNTMDYVITDALFEFNCLKWRGWWWWSFLIRKCLKVVSTRLIFLDLHNSIRTYKSFHISLNSWRLFKLYSYCIYSWLEASNKIVLTFIRLFKDAGQSK